MPSDVGVESELLRRSLNPTSGEAELGKWKQDPLALWLLTNSLPLRAAVEYGGLGGSLPQAPSLEERAQGLAGGNAPIGQASVRRFAKEFVPSVPENIIGQTARDRMRTLIKSYMRSNRMISDDLVGTPFEDFLLDTFVDYAGPSGLRGLRLLTKARQEKRIVDTGTKLTSKYTQPLDYPYTRFRPYISSTGRGSSEWPQLGGQPALRTSDISLKPNAPSRQTIGHELGHKVTGDEPSLEMVQYRGETDPSTVAKVLSSGTPLTEFDKTVLKARAAGEPVPTFEKSGYSREAIQGRIEEYVRAFAEPLFRPRSWRSTPNQPRPDYWMLWEQYPEETKILHDMLQWPIKDVIKKKYPQLFMDPEKQRFIDAFQKTVADEAALYRQHVLPGGLSKKPPAKQSPEFGVGWITPRGEMKPLRSLTNDPFAEHSDVIEKLVQMEGTPNWKGFTRYRYDDEAAYVQFNAQSEEGLNNALEFVKSMHNGERNILVDVSGSPKWEMGEAGSLSFEPFERLPSVLAKIRVAAKKARGEPQAFTP